MRSSQRTGVVGDAGARAALLEAHRAQMVGRFREAHRSAPKGGLSGYLLTLSEPTGYMIAVGLQQLAGTPELDARLLAAMAEGRAPLLAGVVARTALVTVLAGLSPSVERLSAELRAPDIGDARRVLVAAHGGAELLPLEGAVAERPNPK